MKCSPFSIALLGGVLFVSACTKSPAAPSPPPATPPSAVVPPVFSGRVVSALAPAPGIPGVAVNPEGISPTTSDGGGYFSLSEAMQGTFVLRLSSPSWVERQTSMKVPGAPVEVSLIPGTFDLQFFNEMCRGFGGRSLRWTTAPVLIVESSVVEYVGKRATDEQVPASLLEETVEKVRNTLPILSAGRFADFASVQRRTTAVGAVSSVPSGAIALTWQRGLMVGFGHVAYGSRSTRGGGPDLAAGEVALDSEWHIRHLPVGSRTDYELVLQHELGHAVGYSHTTIRPSFMYEVFLMGLSTKDLEAFNVFFQRPSGNQAPDVDPSSSTLNITRAESWSRLDPIP